MTPCLLFSVNAFYSDNTVENLKVGAVATLCMFFGTIGIQDPFRSKVFVRPFPFLWRIAAGALFLQLLVMTFAAFQKQEDILSALHSLVPSLKLLHHTNQTFEQTPSYDSRTKQFFATCYYFARRHEMLPKFLNYFLKAFIFRDWTVLWYGLLHYHSHFLTL